MTMGKVPGTLKAAIILAVLFLLLSPLPLKASTVRWDGAWPDFRGGPQNPGSRDIVLVPEGMGPELKWSVLLSSGVTSPVTGDAQGLYVGTLNGTLFRMDPLTGRTTWHNELGGTIEAAPLVIDNGTAVVAATSEGLVKRFESSNGKVVWSWTNPSNGGIFSSPKESSGLIYFGSYDSSFYCLYSGNGTVRWTYPGCDGYIQTTPGLASVNGRTVVLFGACDGTMNCLDALSGEVIWRFRTAYIPSSPTISDGKVSFGSYDRKLFCLDVNDGSEVWNTSLPDDIYSSPAVLGERVVVGCNDGSLYLLNEGNGTVLWSREMSEGSLESSPILFRDIAAVTTADGLFFLDADNGTVVRGFELGDAADISPTYIDGLLLFGDSYGNVFAISIVDLRTGDDDDNGPSNMDKIIGPVVVSIILISALIFLLLLIIFIRIKKGKDDQLHGRSQYQLELVHNRERPRNP